MYVCVYIYIYICVLKPPTHPPRRRTRPAAARPPEQIRHKQRYDS